MIKRVHDHKLKINTPVLVNSESFVDIHRRDLEKYVNVTHGALTGYKSELGIEINYLTPTGIVLLHIDLDHIDDINFHSIDSSKVNEFFSGYDPLKSYNWLFDRIFRHGLRNLWGISPVTEEYFVGLKPLNDVELDILSGLTVSYEIWSQLSKIFMEGDHPGLAMALLDIRNRWNPCTIRRMMMQTQTGSKILNSMIIRSTSRPTKYSELRHTSDNLFKWIYTSLEKLYGGGIDQNMYLHENNYHGKLPFSCYNTEEVNVFVKPGYVWCLERARLGNLFKRSVQTYRNIYMEIVGPNGLFDPDKLYYQIYLGTPEIILITESSRLFLENIPDDIYNVKLVKHKQDPMPFIELANAINSGPQDIIQVYVYDIEYSET